MSTLEPNGGAALGRRRSNAASMSSSLRRRRSEGLLPLQDDGTVGGGLRQKRIRWAMIAAACCLSLGSHFGTHLLGPLKTTLKTSEHQFAALISASELVNTVTPLLSGLLVPKFGPAKVGLVSTGLVLLGHTIVCWRERAGGSIDVGGMVLGLLLAGGGGSPLSVVQESIILRSSEGSSVGKTLALGLLLGKTASFVSSAVAHPLSSINSRLPFLAAACLSAFSFAACVTYWWLERCLITTDSEDERLAHLYQTKGKALKLSELKRFPPRFYFYCAVCALVGAWDATTHLSSSLLQTLYHITPSAAGAAASVIPFSSILLYPILGALVDRYTHALRRFYILLPLFLITSYTILLYFRQIVPYYLAWVPAALSLGSGPLLIALVVPRLVTRHQAPTALGMHKSLEKAGAIITQFIASVLLAKGTDKAVGSQKVIRFLFGLVVIQLVVIVIWWRVIDRTTPPHPLPGYTAIVDEDEEEEGSDQFETESEDSGDDDLSPGGKATSRIGQASFYACVAFIGASWVVFVYNLTSKRK